MFAFLMVVAVLGGAHASLHAAAGADQSCDAARQQTLGNFLHAEKARTFSNAIATTGEIRANFRNLVWLPLYNEANGRFSQFFLLNGTFTATQAFEACQKLDGAILAKLDTAERVAFTSKFLAYGDYWFGLGRSDKSSSNDFFWSDGNTLSSLYANWQKGEPREAAKGYNCVRTVSPDDVTCNTTMCYSKSAATATWRTAACDGAETYSALCETTYPRALYAYLPGKFDRKSASDACKAAFAGNPNVISSGLAAPKTWAAFSNMINGINFNYKKFDCWTGLERTYDSNNNVWNKGWIDHTATTRWSYLPLAFDNTKTTDTCAEVYDADFAESLKLRHEAFFNFKDCNAQLECAICESYWRL